MTPMQAQIVGLARQGYGPTAIARRTGLNRNTCCGVLVVARNRGWLDRSVEITITSQVRYVPLTADQHTRAVELWTLGRAIRSIAAEVGVKYDQMAKHIEMHRPAFPFRKHPAVTNRNLSPVTGRAKVLPASGITQESINLLYQRRAAADAAEVVEKVAAKKGSVRLCSNRPSNGPGKGHSACTRPAQPGKMWCEKCAAKIAKLREAV